MDSSTDDPSGGSSLPRAGERRRRSELGGDPSSLDSDMETASFTTEDFSIGGDDEFMEDGVMRATLNESVAALRRAYINEKAAPEILPYETELVPMLLAAVENQERAVSSQSRTSRHMYMRSLYQTDIDRVRYLVAAYLRCRLFKIRAFAAHLWTVTEMRRDRLSADEEMFLREMVELQFVHWRDSGLSVLPDEYGVRSVIRDPEVRKGPNLDGFVLACAKDDLDLEVESKEMQPDGTVQTVDIPVRMRAGHILLVRYSTIRDQLITHKTMDLM